MRLLALAGLAIALAAGCSAKSSSTPAGAPFVLKEAPVATSSVTLPKSYRFSPAVIEVQAGTTVTWTNRDNFVHSVKFIRGSAFTGDLPIGHATSTTFSQPGTYYYECSYHPSQMRGEVIVR